MLLIGKPSINGTFSMAMLNNQMVIYIYMYINILNCCFKPDIEHMFH
jgi:hypothetical protein